MNIKKKICVAIIIILVIIIFICLCIKLFYRRNTSTKSANNLIVSNQDIESTISNDIVQNTEVFNNTQENTESQVDETSKKTTTQSISQSNKNPTSSQSENVNTQQKSSSVNAKVVTQESTKTQEATQAQQTNTKQEATQSTQVETKTTTKDEEKYVRNDSMINKIKKVIEDNETEDMKKFGYNIQVDPSIKNYTNQFTFYESRVISNIKNSFGTIKIYAEDYYKNGQFIMTECYIY